MEIASPFLPNVADILYGGIETSLGNASYFPENNCTAFLDRKLMALDTVIATVIMIMSLIFAVKSYSKIPPPTRHDNEPPPEIGYKISARNLLYILYPCHIMTIVQIFLLSVKGSRFSVGMLRLLVPYLYGALLAMLFPDIEDRQEFPGMLVNFWVQHFMIFFVVPPYLVYIYGTQSLEPLREWAWSCFSGVIFGIHHLFILQPVALLTGVNINGILCPFRGDPFSGPYYRLIAVFHQTFCLLTIGKVYSLILYHLIPIFSKQKLRDICS